jgi:hypothetical protein
MITLPALVGSLLLMIVGAELHISLTDRIRILTSRHATASPTMRLIVGNLVGLPVGGLLIVLGRGTAWESITWLLGIVVATILGWTLPRRPERIRDRARAHLVAATPSFLNHLWVTLATGDPPVAALRSYLDRPDRRLATMQMVVQDALTYMDRDRVLPFAAFFEVVQPYRVTFLSDCATILAQSEREGSSPLTALERLRDAVDRHMTETFRLALERRKLLLLLCTAFSVLAVVGQILFVAVVGSDALNLIGNS